MAIGATTTLTPGLFAVELLASATATNSPPSGTSAGLAMNFLTTALGLVPNTLSLAIVSTAGSGTMTATFRLWGYLPTPIAQWVPLGPGGDTTKGTINEGNAIGETGSNQILHVEPVDFPAHFTRLYLEITAIGGTATAVTAWLLGRSPEAY